MLAFGTGRADVSALAQPDKRSANRTRSCKLCLGPKHSVCTAGQEMDSVVINACPLLDSSYRKVMGHKQSKRLAANLKFSRVNSVTWVN